MDRTVRTLAADDFKTYRLPGARADCDQDEAWTRECVHAEARSDKDRQRLGDSLSPVLGRELRQTGSSCQSNEERGGQRWQKTRLTKLSGWSLQGFSMPHASWFGRRGQTRSTSCSGGDR